MSKNSNNNNNNKKIKSHNDVDVEIRKYRDKNKGHFHIIFDRIFGKKRTEDNYVSVGLTTEKRKGKGNPNKKLKHSPFDDGKTSYVRRQGQVDKVHKYSEVKYHGKIDKEDYGIVKGYAKKAKEKYNNLKKDDNKKKKQRAKRVTKK